MPAVKIRVEGTVVISHTATGLSVRQLQGYQQGLPRQKQPGLRPYMAQVPRDSSQC